jgi:hypothetical protein
MATCTLEPVDLARLVHQTMDDRRFAILHEHKVSVTGVDELELSADPTAGREIVFNNLSNAAKYSEPAAPIEVTVERLPESARIVVRNHGHGVTPGDSERIFEKFFQSSTGARPSRVAASSFAGPALGGLERLLNDASSGECRQRYAPGCEIVKRLQEQAWERPRSRSHRARGRSRFARGVGPAYTRACSCSRLSWSCSLRSLWRTRPGRSN